MSDAVKKKRPQYANIHISQIVRYRLPLAALVSILHRISGAFMFLLLPFIVYMLEKSLTSEISFDYLSGLVSNWFVKLLLLGLSWAYLHHLCAGIRHLFMDAHIGGTKEGSRKSAAGVLVISLVLTLAMALKLLGVF